MKRLGLILSLLAFRAWSAEEAPLLSLDDARAAALQHHPRISAAELQALAAGQRVVQARSAFYPTVFASATAVGTGDDNTRIAAGGMSNPGIFERNAEGITVSQLITDFGRSANLAGSARLRARAEEANSQATRAGVLLAIDSAYFTALESIAIKKVAEETVTTRELLFNQVTMLASNKLKSDLDVSFSRVTLEEGKLLLNKAENDLQAAGVTLSILMGDTNARPYRLLEPPPVAEKKDAAADEVQQALARRPELADLRLQRDAAWKFARAERALHYPTVSAVGTAGVIPFHDSHLRDDYIAAGVNLNLPLFSGNLYTARQREAELLARRADELVRDGENSIIREVRVAVQNVAYARKRLELSQSFLTSASQAYDLAQARYDIGASSIVELSQAQLNKTSAQIAFQNARYEYRIQTAALNFQTGATIEMKPGLSAP